MSTYLFVICMERLGQTVKMKVASKEWHPIQLGRDRVEIPYLFFANNIILFVEVSNDQAMVIIFVLKDFSFRFAC